jgi:hypothetical protein
MNTHQIRIANTAFSSKEMNNLLRRESHHIHTPFETARKIIQDIDFIGKKYILVLYNAEIVYSLIYDFNINPNKIVFITDHAIKKSYAHTVCGLQSNKIFILKNTKTIEDMLIKFSRSEKVKFDVVIANPPYERGKHLDFLDLSFELLNQGGQCIFIHPSEWLVNKKRISSSTKKRSQYKVLRDKYDCHETSIRFVDNPFGENAKIFLPITITSITKNNNSSIRFIDERKSLVYGKYRFKSPSTFNLQTLAHVSQWGDGKTEQSFLDKVYATLSNNFKLHLDKVYGNWYVSLSTVSADGFIEHVYLDGVYRKISNMYSVTNSMCLSPTNEPQTTSRGKQKMFVSFQTQSEAQNCIDFLTKTKFMRAYLAIIKSDQNVKSGLTDLLPYLDFTKIWNDSSLYSYFNLTQDEIDYIESIVEKITE